MITEGMVLVELFSDKPALAAAALTRLAAADLESGGKPPGRMQVFLGDLVMRNGPDILERVAIELARQHLASLEELALATGRPAARYLDSIELAAAMDEEPDGGQSGLGIPPHLDEE
ncbi:hypothetical protein [Pseudarthrobacter equi]|uniref:hypothetical protein n=1 Tax=Pseudarthrobacter equi TaxID=728066 RepID=UPI0028D7FF0C|nr:hypothetical protein [Pseudarthrobacter equi]